MSNELTHNSGQFDEVIHIIDNARSRAMKAVNAELIQMYWEIGAYVSSRVKDGGWGKSVVTDFSEFLQAWTCSSGRDACGAETRRSTGSSPIPLGSCRPV